MNLSISRKWRQFFKRYTLRSGFTVVLILVFINIIIYLIWNHYNLSLKNADKNLENTDIINNNIYDFENSTYPNYKLPFRQNKYFISKNDSLPLCPEQPPNLMGRFVPDLIEYHWHVIESKNPNVSMGHWSPSCQKKQQVAIIIPYRNRKKHIKILVNNLHSFLQRQQQDYGIFVIEQMSGTSFNRAMLFNIGFMETLKWYNFNCFIFHDVDLIPENDYNLYQCSNNPKHLSAYIDKFSYKLPYEDLFGGVCAINIKQFQHVNGFSNFYFGWGGEDDDMSKRLRFHGYKIFRYPHMIGSYKMIKHNGDSGNAANSWRFSLVRSATIRMRQDGLNNLEYKVSDTIVNKLTVWLKVQVDEIKIKRNYSIWINQTFFEADLNYQLKVVAVVLLLFIGSLGVMCSIVICALRVTPDSHQPLVSNKILNSQKIHIFR